MILKWKQIQEIVLFIIFLLNSRWNGKTERQNILFSFLGLEWVSFSSEEKKSHRISSEYEIILLYSTGISLNLRLSYIVTDRNCLNRFAAHHNCLDQFVMDRNFLAKRRNDIKWTEKMITYSSPIYIEIIWSKLIHSQSTLVF